MTDTQEQTLPAADKPKSAATGNAPAGRAPRAATKQGGLSSKLLPELQQIAGGMGINTAKKKKSDLVAAIQAARSEPAAAPAAVATKTAATRTAATKTAAPVAAAPSVAAPRTARSRTRSGAAATAQTAPAEASAPQSHAPATNPRQSVGDQPQGEHRGGQNRGQDRTNEDRHTQGAQDQDRHTSEDRQNNQGGSGQDRQSNQDRQNNQSAGNQGQNRQNNQGTGSQGQNRQNNQGTGSPGQSRQNNQGGSAQGGSAQNRQTTSTQHDDDDDFDGGRRRGRRYRDRRGRNRPVGSGQGSGDAEPMLAEDDVLVPVAGVVDAIEEKNAWFVRVEGYFATPDDVFISTALVRKHGLRRGDAITGAVRQPREGERREKYNPLVRVDTVNGGDPEQIKNRPEFTKLTPLYPQQRLRLETEPHILTTRVIDLVMPIGKGQRALIVSPPKAGKTMVLQAIANAIAVNNPEVHLMVVLIDERPEEVTDMQRSVRGEVIASTFDRRPQDHITVAELSIERAKRLVEMGHDVVVLLDSITRLGRAYNLGAPASGRILSGGVDSTALYPPKRFLGAARNIEDGGSLTILATALVETGSAGDTVIFEEFKGTGNAELKLDRKIADKRTFPAVDVDQSSTRKEELLLSPDELAVTIKLRRVLHALDSQQGIELLLDRLRKTRTNIEFLMQIAKTTPGQD
ncbi:MAG: transcription termination factor Rho [Jatrophihabitans sp.]